MSTYTFLPQGFTNWQDSPQPPIPPYPSFPGGVSFPVGVDQREGGQRWLAEGGDARWGDPTRPSEKNGTFLHLSRDIKLP